MDNNFFSSQCSESSSLVEILGAENFIENNATNSSFEPISLSEAEIREDILADVISLLDNDFMNSKIDGTFLY